MLFPTAFRRLLWLYVEALYTVHHAATSSLLRCGVGGDIPQGCDLSSADVHGVQHKMLALQKQPANAFWCVQHSASQDAVPLLLTAQPDGVHLAAFLRELATKDDSPPAELWAVLRCLPHACQKSDQARTYKHTILHFSPKPINMPL